MEKDVYKRQITMIVKCTIGRMYARGKVGFHFRKTALLLDSGHGKKGQREDCTGIAAGI